MAKFARMDDDWREDGSLRGLNGGGGAQGKARGKGPQFTRVIPKFLQQYHQPPAIQAKFATLPKEEEEEEGLDEVQQAAIDEYLATKKEKETTVESSKVDGEEGGGNMKKKCKTSGQNVVEVGKSKTGDATRKKTKRKRADRLIGSRNPNLLSFSMDEEE